jgi:hypothetical protein
MLFLDKKAILDRSLEGGNTMKFRKFVAFNNIPPDTIYVDKFFHNLDKEVPILLDEEVIKYFGYSENMPEENPKQIRNKNKMQKKGVKELFEANFTEYKNQLWWTYDTSEYEKFLRFEQLDHKEIKNLSPEMLKTLYPLVKKKGQQPTYILIMPKLFKKGLMLCQTEKGKKVRSYYLDMMEVMVGQQYY